jgi:hypothetical protein
MTRIFSGVSVSSTSRPFPSASIPTVRRVSSFDREFKKAFFKIRNIQARRLVPGSSEPEERRPTHGNFSGLFGVFADKSLIARVLMQRTFLNLLPGMISCCISGQPR